jgi:pimeloyl-ACP methyl ester carboxylesterase
MRIFECWRILTVAAFSDALIINYYTNLDQYPTWQAYLRKHQPAALIVWGKGDQIFLPPGAEAYKRDLSKAEIHFFDTGHFALEEGCLGYR